MQGVTPQNRHLVSVTQSFLDVHWDQKRPILLGYSGGPDSKALLYSLIECGVKPHIAHVDHGWREESKLEADLLKKEAVFLGCPFFTTRLDLKKSEDAARRGRLLFFKSLKESYQALLLAHQAEDLAETVLKRIFEGAHLTNLGGMEPVSTHYGMTIWRPFLSLEKKEIFSFLEKKDLQWVEDSTNKDPTYLRSRMRGELFPFLNKTFGKEVRLNLNVLSERSFELRRYLDKMVDKVRVQEGPWGTLLDLNGLEDLEKKHLILRHLSLSRDMLDTLISWLKMGLTNKKLETQSKKILVDKGRICIISLPPKDSVLNF